MAEAGNDQVGEHVDGEVELAIAVDTREVRRGEGDLWQTGCLERVLPLGDSLWVAGSERRTGGNLAKQGSDQRGQQSAREVDRVLGVAPRPPRHREGAFDGGEARGRGELACQDQCRGPRMGDGDAAEFAGPGA